MPRQQTSIRHRPTEYRHTTVHPNIIGLHSKDKNKKKPNLSKQNSYKETIFNTGIT